MGTYTEAYLDWVEEKRAKRDEGFANYARRFYVSSLGSCPRKQVLQRDNVPGRPMTRKKKRFFEDRSALHDLRVQAWWDKGLALTADLPEGHRDRETARFRLTPYLPEHFGGRPDIVDHGADPKDAEYLRGCFRRMLQAHAQGEGWERYAEELRQVGVSVADAKTSRPGQAKYVKDGPKLKDLGQVSRYAHCLNDAFALGVTEVRIVYCMIGSEEDDFEHVVPLPDKGETGIEADEALLVEYWVRYMNSPQEDPWQRDLPPVMPLEVEVAKESYERDKKKLWRDSIRLRTHYDCDGYCPYSDHGCAPVKSKLQKGDLLGVVQEDGTWVYASDLCEKAGFVIPEGALSLGSKELLR